MKQKKFPRIQLTNNRPMLFVMQDIPLTNQSSKFFRDKTGLIIYGKAVAIDHSTSLKIIYGDIMDIYAANETPLPIWWRHKITSEQIKFTKDNYIFLGYL